MHNYKIDYIKGSNTYPIYDLSNANLTPSVMSAEYTDAINTGGLITLELTPDHPYINELVLALGEIRLYRDAAVIFRGRISSISTSLYGYRTVEVEGLASRMLDAPVGTFNVAGLEYDSSIGAAQLESGNAFYSFAVLMAWQSHLPSVEGSYIIPNTSMPASDGFYCSGSGTAYDGMLAAAQALGGYVTFDYTSRFGSSEGDILIDYGKGYTEHNEQALMLGDNLIELERQQGLEDFYNSAFVLNDTEVGAAILDSGTSRYSGYTIENATLLNQSSVAEYGPRIKLVETKDLTLSQMEDAAYQAINASSIYDRVSVSALDMSETETWRKRITEYETTGLRIQSNAFLQAWPGAYTGYFPVEPGATYTISNTNNFMIYCGYTTEAPAIDTVIYGYKNVAKKVTITPGDNAAYIVFGFVSSGYVKLTEVNFEVISETSEKTYTETRYVDVFTGQRINATVGTGSISAAERYKTIALPCVPGKTYTIAKTKGKRFRYGYIAQEPAIGVSVSGYKAFPEGTGSGNLTCGNDAKYIVIDCYSDYVSTDRGTSIAEMLNSITVSYTESITVKAAPFEVGKLVTITSQPHGLNGVDYPLTAVTRNLLYPQDVKLTLGQRTITLSGNVIY